MTATQLRYRRYLGQKPSTLAIAEFFRKHPQFADCEFAFTSQSVTIFAKEPNADLADICESSGFDLVVDGPDPARRDLNPLRAEKMITMILVPFCPWRIEHRAANANAITGERRPSARPTGEDQRPGSSNSRSGARQMDKIYGAALLLVSTS